MVIPSWDVLFGLRRSVARHGTIHLPRVAHVEQQGGRVGGAMGHQVANGELFQQSLNRGGSSKPARRGATLSNSSTLAKSCSLLRVNRVARMMGSWPTIAA